MIKPLKLLISFLWQIAKQILFLAIYTLKHYVLRVPEEKHPFLQGNFGPVVDEQVAVPLTLKRGSGIPSELNGGAYIRNGPNPRYNPTPYEYHWFSGDGMLHCVHILPSEEDGSQLTATYTNRFIRTSKLNKELASDGKHLHHHIRYFTSPLSGLQSVATELLLRLKKFGAPVKLLLEYIAPVQYGTANTALEFHDRRLLALVENYAPHHVVAPLLQTVGEYRYGGKLKHPFTAHPKVDAETKEMFFFGYSIRENAHCTYSVVDSDGQLISSIPIHLPRPVMMHDFAITKNYAIFLDLPFTMQVSKVAMGKALMDFEPKFVARFGILPRYATSDSEIRWISCSTSFYMFHVANAFEVPEADEIVIHGCRAQITNGFNISYYDSEMQRLHPKIPAGGIPAELYEWRLDIKNGVIRSERSMINKEIIGSQSTNKIYCEFPTIHPGLIGRPNRYVYLARLVGDSELPLVDAVIKYDLKTNEHFTFTFDEGCYARECVFIPRNQQNDHTVSEEQEDDGFLTTFLYDSRTNQSTWMVLDAQKLGKCDTEALLAEMELPRRVPYGFHGKWLSHAQIESQRGL